MANYETLRTKLAAFGQDHLLKFWPKLSEVERKHLASELVGLDLQHISESFKKCQEDFTKASETVDDQLEPLPKSVLGSFAKCDSATLKRYEDEGLKQIGEGKVAVLLLAGGQGTRLGVTYPKGMYDVGLPSHKSLYHLQAQRLVKIQELASKRVGKDCVVPWYIMMSEQTREPTTEFFKKHAYFGLRPENVVMFEQSTMPCIDHNGKIILETPSSIAKAPDGNGGLYNALRKAKILDNIIQRGVEYLHVYCVDNILVKMADPVFIGFCIAKGASCGVKVVEKTSASEPVGVICKLNGKYHVVEYSEISLKTAEKRDADGKLVFNAGGIANHFFLVDFMKMIVLEKESALRYHVAQKKIPYCNDEGKLVKPTQVNGIKMEKFIFDIFQFATSFAVWDVLREDEFAPLKNGNDAAKDNPITCRASLMDLHHRWVLKAGGKFKRENDSVISDIPSRCMNSSHPDNNNESSHKEDSEESPIICEVSPLISYSGEGLEDRVRGKSFIPPVVLWQDGEPH